MADPQIETQRQTRAAEGLALTWEAVPGAIRYGFIVGFPDMPVPPLDVIMKGATKDFAVMGVPARFTGAVDLGSPAGEERQYGLVAYRGDGSIISVPGVQYAAARSAPRDREYHPLMPPALVRSTPAPLAAPRAVPSSPIPSQPPAAATPGAASAVSGAPDPWDALAAASAAEAVTDGPAPALPSAPQPADPWDLLGPAAPEEPAAPPDAAVAPFAAAASGTPAPEPVAPPRPSDPWDLLDAGAGEDTAPDSPAPAEPVTEPVAAVASPRPPDPWDMLSTAATSPLSTEGDTVDVDGTPPAAPVVAPPTPVPSIADQRPAATEDAPPAGPSEPAASSHPVEPEVIRAAASAPEPAITQPEPEVVGPAASLPAAPPVEPIEVASRPEPVVSAPVVSEPPAAPPDEPLEEPSPATPAPPSAVPPMVSAQPLVTEPPATTRLAPADLPPGGLAPAASAQPDLAPEVAEHSQPIAPVAPVIGLREVVATEPAVPPADALVAAAEASSPTDVVPPATDAPGQDHPAATDVHMPPVAPAIAVIESSIPLVTPVPEDRPATSFVTGAPGERASTQAAAAGITPAPAGATLDAGHGLEQAIVPTTPAGAADEIATDEIATDEIATDEIAAPEVEGAPLELEPDATPTAGLEYEQSVAAEPAPDTRPEPFTALDEDMPRAAGAAVGSTGPLPDETLPIPASDAVRQEPWDREPWETETAGPPAAALEVTPEVEAIPAAMPANEVEAIPAAMPANEPTPPAQPVENAPLAAARDGGDASFAASVEEIFAREFGSAQPAHDDEFASVEEPAHLPASESPATPVPGPAAAPAAPDPAVAASLAALLDEAEMYLLPSWLDYAEAGRLLAEAARIAPADPRVRALQTQLDQPRGGATGAGGSADPLLADARRLLDGGDYWGAVDLYEQVLTRRPDDDDARRGVARARLLARWSAQLAGAGTDAERLRALGDAFAAESPDLAGQAYAASFREQPTTVTLHSWLTALAHGGRADIVASTARQGVDTLRQTGRIGVDPAQDEALATLQDRAAAAGADASAGVVAALERLARALDVATL